MIFNSYLTPYANINLKWTIECRTYTIKPLEDNIGENFCELGLGKNVSVTTPKSQYIKEKY